MSTAMQQNAYMQRVSPGALKEIERELRKSNPLHTDDLCRLAERLKMPSAAIRGTASYYGDLSAPHDAVRVCHGTSCQLAGADRLHEQTKVHGPSRGVFCLGYCDRSPVVLHPDGHVAVECVDGTGDESAASIRSTGTEPIVMRRLLQGDFADFDKAYKAGVYGALEQALSGPPGAVMEAMRRSGHRGRGGAGYPAARKWQACAAAPGERKYVIANGDEGDPGSFIDRLLMELDPHSVLEGMALCAYAVGAGEGIVFIRSEYPEAIRRMTQAIADARSGGILGKSVVGRNFTFDVEVFRGRGSYVCGEETAMLNTIEGRRGEVRLRPPYPVEAGLWGNPTVVNNVETLVSVPWIIERGPAAYAALGMASCSGTKVMFLNRGFARPGVVEVEFGTSLRDVIEGEGGGGRRGAKLEAVFMGGPMGSVLGPEQWDVPIGYSAMADQGLVLGHGGLIAVHAPADWARLLQHWLRFMQHESCGKCVPCRMGSKYALAMIDSVRSDADRLQLDRLLDVIADASLCAFGQLMPGPIRQMIARLGDRIFEERAPS